MALKRERWVALGALLVVALIVGLALELKPPVTRPTTTQRPSSPPSTSGESSYSSQQSTPGAKVIIVPPSSASTLNSLTGLSLNLNLSTSYNEWVIVTAYEFNTLDLVNNVSAGGRWPNNTSLFQWGGVHCLAQMAGYEILRGNYGLGNFSQGTALWLSPEPGAYNCPMSFPPDSYTFKPLSEANV